MPFQIHFDDGTGRRLIMTTTIRRDMKNKRPWLKICNLTPDDIALYSEADLMNQMFMPRLLALYTTGRRVALERNYAVEDDSFQLVCVDLPDDNAVLCITLKCKP